MYISVDVSVLMFMGMYVFNCIHRSPFDLPCQVSSSSNVQNFYSNKRNCYSTRYPVSPFQLDHTHTHTKALNSHNR